MGYTLLRRVVGLQLSSGKEVVVPDGCQVYRNRKHYIFKDDQGSEKEKLALSWVAALFKVNGIGNIQKINMNHDRERG